MTAGLSLKRRLVNFLKRLLVRLNLKNVVSGSWRYVEETYGTESDLADDSPSHTRGGAYSSGKKGHGNSAKPGNASRGSIIPEDDLQELLHRNSKSVGGVLVLLVGVVVGSWVLGACGASWAWLLVAVGLTWGLVRGNLESIAEQATRHESLRLHRRRALQADETCEWLNLVINRWWVFSSASIFTRLKSLLDPKLNDAKPAFLETISLKQLTLGDRTPMLRTVRAWDVTNPAGGEGVGGGGRGIFDIRPPPGLSHSPTHTLALLCDLALDSDNFSAVLAARIGGKGVGVDLDVAVEKLAVLGRVVLTLTLNMEAPFPHLTRIALSFTDKPQVWFSVRILKAVQMMEVPVLKTWLHSLVTDALATAWVDPGQLEFNIHSPEAFVPEQRSGDALAQGVLTVIMWTQRGVSSGGQDDDKWVVVVIGGQQHVTTPIASHRWQEACSFLVDSSPSTQTLVVKVKTKRLITTTLTQYELPLSQYNLDTCRVVETILQKKGVKVMGGSVPMLHLRLQYTPLTPVNLEAPLPPSPTDTKECAGVLYIVIHGADNIGASECAPSPYCLVFNNRRKIKTTHYVSECASPRWECGVELLVTDVSAVTLSVAVCSMPRAAQDTELLGLASLSLATVELPLLRQQLALTRSLPTPGGAAGSSPSQPGTVTVTLVFRAVPSVAGCNVTSCDLSEGKGPTALTSFSHVPPPLSVGSSMSAQRRTSITGIDEDDNLSRRKMNSHWINQAKQLLSTTRDGEFGMQDIGDIIASGLGLIELTIIRARDLVAKDLNGFSDPYCVVKVNGEVKYRTRVMKKTLNPEWEETLITHLPKPPDALAITLWDHDAFGRDFLGSVSLQEMEVRQMSQADGPIWKALEGTKSGQLEIRVKVISDDYEHQIIAARTASASLTSGMILEGAKCDPASDACHIEEHAGTSSGEDSGIILPQPSPLREHEEERPPRVPAHSMSYTSSGGLPDAQEEMDSCRRSSESALPYNQDSPSIDNDSSSYSSSINQPCSGGSPTHNSKSRKTGAKIIASALAMARSSKGRGDAAQSDCSNASSPSISHQGSITSTHQSKPLPKISLPEHSEDDYGGGGNSSPEHAPKSKKSDGGLRAVKEKMRRGFAHPLRRFRSEASVRDAPTLSPEVQSCESPEPHVELTLSGISTGMRLGVGGGEGDASELLDATLSHAKSQPNLLLLPCNNNRSTASTKLSGESGHVHRVDVFMNVRGVAGRVQGLHIPRSGLQLFLRVRISDEKHSSSGNSSRSTKTVGRSRLVPASPSPTFECEWVVEGEVSRRATLVLEVRTGSRELLNSANIVLGDLFTEPGTEGSIETWVNLQGGATLHLRANHGGTAPASTRRRSLFRSWSLHRLGRI
ncbi:uncharacterized protein LOC135200357 isoform X2 [Macrobrachium nipponense]|uniref:uncharacterized protein LOC135200357 isoform X2 n=1 Tax=Macrobrachium nipponense TaxID=159736 RepID=UPI0030C8C37F